MNTTVAGHRRCDKEWSRVFMCISTILESKQFPPWIASGLASTENAMKPLRQTHFLASAAAGFRTEVSVHDSA